MEGKCVMSLKRLFNESKFSKITLKGGNGFIYNYWSLTLILNGPLRLSSFSTLLTSFCLHGGERPSLWIRDEIDSKDQRGHLANDKGSRVKHKGKNCSYVLGKGSLFPFRISPSCSHFFLAMILFSPILGFCPVLLYFTFQKASCPGQNSLFIFF